MAGNMNIKDKIPLIVAVILGLLSIIAINKYIQAKVSLPEGQKAKIIVAKNYIAKKQEITLNDLQTKVIPVKALSQVSITVPLGNTPAEKREAYRMKMLLVGRKPVRNVSPGEPILWTDLVDDEAERLSKLLKTDTRGIAVPVNQVTAVGFNIMPGDHVDVIATLEPQALNMFGNLTRVRQNDNYTMAPADSSGPTTHLIMQDVEVLAVGQNYNAIPSDNAYFSNQTPDNYSTVTLEVTVEEAVLLSHVRRLGTISFILRPLKSLNRLKNPGFIQVDDKNISQNINILDESRATKIEKMSAAVKEEALKKEASQKKALEKINENVNKDKIKKTNQPKSDKGNK
jgi:pilus assembly protein CpaB